MFSERCPTCKQLKKRNSHQNRLYWALLSLIAEQLPVKGQGYTSQTWHHYLGQRYLGCHDVTLPNGKVLTMPISTSTLSVDEFAEYFDRCVAWASEHGIVLPDQDGSI